MKNLQQKLKIQKLKRLKVKITYNLKVKTRKKMSLLSIAILKKRRKNQYAVDLFIILNNKKMIQFGLKCPIPTLINLFKCVDH